MLNKSELTTATLKLRDQLFDPNSQMPRPSGWGLLFILALGVSAALMQFQKPKAMETPMQKVENIDIFIPAGESLVPIQVANYESLDQIIGQYGVVDLYTTPLNPMEKTKKIAYAVKLVRSPQSPRHFSVLLPADKAHKLAGFHGEFTVVVRNPKIIGTHFVKERTQQRKKRVVYEMEGQ